MVFRTKPFYHRHRGALATAPLDVKLVHKRPRQIDAAAGALEKRFGRPWVRQTTRIEAVALIGDCDPQLRRSPGDRQHDLFVHVPMVTVDDRVGHDFVNGEANMFHSNFPEAAAPGHLERRAFGAICAIQSRIQYLSCRCWQYASAFARSMCVA